MMRKLHGENKQGNSLLYQLLTSFIKNAFKIFPINVNNQKPFCSLPFCSSYRAKLNPPTYLTGNNGEYANNEISIYKMRPSKYHFLVEGNIYQLHFFFKLQFRFVDPFQFASLLNSHLVMTIHLMLLIDVFSMVINFKISSNRVFNNFDTGAVMPKDCDRISSCVCRGRRMAFISWFFS